MPRQHITEDLVFFGAQFDKLPSQDLASVKPHDTAPRYFGYPLFQPLSPSSLGALSKATRDVLSSSNLSTSLSMNENSGQHLRHDEGSRQTEKTAHVTTEVVQHNQGQHVGATVRHVSDMLSPASSKDSLIVHPSSR